MSEPIARIIHRLMRELEDGSFEVAGYQVFDNGHILHGHDCRVYNDIFDRVEAKISNISINAIYAPMCVKEGERFICNVESEKPSLSFKHPNYIPHTRIDRYTGITLNDEAKLFERDEVEVTDEMDEIGSTDTGHGKIEYLSEKALWYIDGDINNSLTDIVDSCCFARYIKIVGIEGVHKTEERGKG